MELTHGISVLVTGANGGIGAAIARSLAARGASLILSGRRADALAPLAAELDARVVVADLAKPADVARLGDEAGEIDVAVLNAANPAAGPLTSFTPEELDAAIRVNLVSPAQTARALVPGMIARGRGQLVFISSINGLVAGPGTSIYSATKFGLRGFALGLRAELAEHGVGVTTVFPGFIRDAGMFAASGAKLPLGVGTRSPDDVARGVIRAIERDPAEITVAALDQRLASFVGGVFPGLASFVGRSEMAKSLSREVAEGQRRAGMRR